ncbi:MAG: aldo/keto reductase [Marmoricola sp.]|nr:aldo/keto reductase [Marmoricola sp.]
MFPFGNSSRGFLVGTGMTVPALTLHDGTSIPQFGFGVFQVPPPETAKIVTDAFEAGYRHIDTAQMYGNERGVGEALASSGLARDDVYLTTKLNNGFHRPDDARAEMEKSLERLGTDHVDLFLIHWPLPTKYDGDYVSTWETLIELQAAGHATSIGVSNFQVDHLARLAAETSVVPAVNQIEVHPYFGNEAVRAADAAAGILTEAWSPIAQGAVLDDPVITGIADRIGRTPSQVTLRWHIERGDIVFPKTVSIERMRENAAIFDFELSDADRDAITALDRGEDGRRGPNPSTFDWMPE